MSQETLMSSIQISQNYPQKFKRSPSAISSTCYIYLVHIVIQTLGHVLSGTQLPNRSTCLSSDSLVNSPHCCQSDRGSDRGKHNVPVCICAEPLLQIQNNGQKLQWIQEGRKSDIELMGANRYCYLENQSMQHIVTYGNLIFPLALLRCNLNTTVYK